MKIEIIPAIDIIGGRCVRLSQGEYSMCTEYKASPIEMAKRYEDCGVKMVHIVDLEGAKSNDTVNLKCLEEIAAKSALKIEFGGGIKSLERAKSIINAGADRVICGSIAVKEPALFRKIISELSPERVVLGADVKGHEIAIEGWREASGVGIEPLIDGYKDENLQNVIITDISKDGMLKGPSTELYKWVMKRFQYLNIIGSGGIGNMSDIYDLQDIGMKHIIVGKAIYEGKISLKEIEKFNK